MGGINLNESGLDFVRQVFVTFGGNTTVLTLFLLSVLYLALKGKKEERYVFVTTAVFLAFTVYNPFAVKYILGKLGMVNVYYRFFWILPMVLTIGYACTKVVGGQKKGWRRYLTAAALAAVICFGGNSVLAGGLPKLPDNQYKMPDDLLAVCTVLHEEAGEGTVRVVFEPDFNLLFFVEALDWGSEGCALSTVLSEGMCCLLCALYIRWKVPVLQLGRRWFVFDGKLLCKTVSYGWVSAMQQATVQLGKIAVQAIVNTMGVSAMAAFTAASRIDDFAYTPQQNIGHAMTTFMAQNEGAGKKDRVKDGYRCGMRIEVVYALGLMAVCLIFAEPIIRLFVTDPEVVDLGVRFLRTISLFYLMPAATNGIQGFFRGIGDLRITLISSILNMAGRVAAASVLVLLWKMEIEALPYSYVFGWVLMLAYELPAMLRYLRKNKM